MKVNVTILNECDEREQEIRNIINEAVSELDTIARSFDLQDSEITVYTDANSTNSDDRFEVQARTDIAVDFVSALYHRINNSCRGCIDIHIRFIQ